MFQFLNDLSESHLISSKTSLKNWKPKKLAELGFLYFLGLRILLSDDSTREWAKNYCRKTSEPNDFLTWRTTQNDLYAILYGLSAEPDETLIDGKLDDISISSSFVRNWLRHVGLQSNIKDETHKLFVRLDAMFNITNSQMKSLRRTVTEWDDINNRERGETIIKLIQLIHACAPSNSEILPKLKQLGYEDEIKESATSGATGAANVATVAGGLGAGFESNESGSWRSIYGQKKPVVIRRIPKEKK